MVEIINREYRCELKNGKFFNLNLSDYMSFLKANVLERVQVIVDVRVFLYTKLSSWYFANLGGGAYKISADQIDITSFTVGDSIKLRGWDNSWVISGIITSIGDNFIYIDNYISLTGSPSINAINGTTNADFMYLNDVRDDVYFSFNILPEAETDSFLNVYDSTINKYLIENVTGTAKSGVWVGQTQTGSLGFITCKKLANTVTGQAFSGSDTVALNYQFEHNFIVAPYIQDSTKEDVINNTPIEDLRGDLSYKYLTGFEFRKSIVNEKSIISKTFSEKASIGGFGESGNGYFLPFKKVSVNYSHEGNAVDSLVSGVTDVTVIVENLSGNFELLDDLVLYHSYILTDEEASLSPVVFKDLWKWESIRTTISSAPVSSGIFQNVDFDNVSSNICFLNFQINNTSNKEYLLALGLGDYTLTAENDSKGIILLDTNTYYKNTDIEGLFEVSNLNVYEQFQNTEVVGYTNYEGVIQDDVLIDGVFWVLEDSIIDSFTLSYVATNGMETKKIYSLDFDVDFDIVNGIQQINFTESLGYDSNFNIKEIKFSEKVADKIYYTFKANMKLSHQDWLKAKEQLNDFYDANIPLNGINRDLKTYDGVNSYTVKLEISSNIIYTGITTEYNTYTTDFLIKDYEEEVNTTGLTNTLCEIKYYNLEGAELPTGVIPTNQEFFIHSIFKIADLDLNLYDCVTYVESGLGDNTDLKQLDIISKSIVSDTIVFVQKSRNFNRIASRIYKITSIELSYLLQENGFYILQENGSKIII